jgi:hypothetical protein
MQNEHIIHTYAAIVQRSNKGNKMANKALYKFVGVSTLDGVINVRYANSKGRTSVLLRNGHTDVTFVEMPLAEREEDCVDFLLKQDFVQDNFETLAAVTQEAERLGFVF